jgi:hypothetical protein
VKVKGAPKTNIVSQALCSALSIGYSSSSSSSPSSPSSSSSCSIRNWEQLARIVLYGMYEGTILASIINSKLEGGSNIVVLTFVGGGVFRNQLEWIVDAICNACARYAFYDIEVHIAHFLSVNPKVKEMIDQKYAESLCALDFDDSVQC